MLFRYLSVFAWLRDSDRHPGYLEELEDGGELALRGIEEEMNHELELDAARVANGGREERRKQAREQLALCVRSMISPETWDDVLPFEDARELVERELNLRDRSRLVARYRRRAEVLYEDAAAFRADGDVRAAEDRELAAADYMEDAERIELGLPVAIPGAAARFPFRGAKAAS